MRPLGSTAGHQSATKRVYDRLRIAIDYRQIGSDGSFRYRYMLLPLLQRTRVECECGGKLRLRHAGAPADRPVQPRPRRYQSHSECVLLHERRQNLPKRPCAGPIAATPTCPAVLPACRDSSEWSRRPSPRVPLRGYRQRYARKLFHLLQRPWLNPFELTPSMTASYGRSGTKTLPPKRALTGNCCRASPRRRRREHGSHRARRTEGSRTA